MIVAAAILFSASLGIVGWVLSHQAREMDSIEVRAQKAFNASSGSLNADQIKSLQISEKQYVHYEDCSKNFFKKNLFLAGIRKRSTIRLIEFSIWLAAVSPFITSLALVFMDRFESAVLFKMMLMVVVGLIASLFMLKIMIGRRQRRILKDLPEFFDLTVVCMEAGFNFTAALPRVIKEMDPKSILVQEFRSLHNEFLGGIGLTLACERTIQRCNVPDITRSLNSIIQSEKLGTSLGQTFRVFSQEVRDKLRQRVRERAHRIPVKIVFPMMIMLFGGLLLMLGGTVFYRLQTALKAAGLN